MQNQSEEYLSIQSSEHVHWNLQSLCQTFNVLYEIILEPAVVNCECKILKLKSRQEVGTNTFTWKNAQITCRFERVFGFVIRRAADIRLECRRFWFLMQMYIISLLISIHLVHPRLISAPVWCCCTLIYLFIHPFIYIYMWWSTSTTIAQQLNSSIDRRNHHIHTSASHLVYLHISVSLVYWE
jgi:hypothetical protein